MGNNCVSIDCLSKQDSSTAMVASITAPRHTQSRTAAALLRPFLYGDGDRGAFPALLAAGAGVRERAATSKSFAGVSQGAHGTNGSAACLLAQLNARVLGCDITPLSLGVRSRDGLRRRGMRPRIALGAPDTHHTAGRPASQPASQSSLPACLPATSQPPATCTY